MEDSTLKSTMKIQYAELQQKSEEHQITQIANTSGTLIRRVQILLRKTPRTTQCLIEHSISQPARWFDSTKPDGLQKPANCSF